MYSWDLLTFTLCTLILGGAITPLYSQEFTHSIPIKVDIEIRRNYNFLRLLVSVKNLSCQSQHFSLKLSILKKDGFNLSKIVQAKKIYLKEDEFLLPFITEFLVNPQDTFEIKLQVFDLTGKLVMERIWEYKGI